MYLLTFLRKKNTFFMHSGVVYGYSFLLQKLLNDFLLKAWMRLL